MQSLLGQFYNRIRGSQEDIASESLVYILNKSVKVRQTISQIVKLNTGLIFSDILYKTQNVGKKLERPDISGMDENGVEALLIEAKFWSSLTSNQPNEYLNRLGANGVLIFLVPSLRMRAIYEEVYSRVSERYTDTVSDSNNLIIEIGQAKKFIIIKSWNEVLNAIKSKLIQGNDQSLISDIDQVIGFCDTIDTNSFQPVVDSDLSPGIAKKICSYYDIVDKVVDELKNRNDMASTKGLMRTPQQYGYRRYFSLPGYGFGMSLNMDLWSKYADTPFWFFVTESKERWVSTPKFIKTCEKVAFNLNCKLVEINGEVFFSLKPILDQTEDVVIDNLASQIEDVYVELVNHKSTNHG